MKFNRWQSKIFIGISNIKVCICCIIHDPLTVVLLMKNIFEIMSQRLKLKYDHYSELCILLESNTATM